MKIEKIIFQNRRDFQAVYVCKHCGYQMTDYGYDDTNFHINVIPKMLCPKCGKTAPDDYRPLMPKYPDHVTV